MRLPFVRNFRAKRAPAGKIRAMYTRPRYNADNIDDVDHYASACEKALNELNDTLLVQGDLKARLKEIEQRVSRLRPLAVSLYGQCKEPTRVCLAEKFDTTELLNLPENGRVSDLLRQVEHAFRQSDANPLCAGDVINRLNASGVSCSSKAVYNAIQRLAHAGHLVRVSRGRYLAPEFGIAFETSDLPCGNY